MIDVDVKKRFSGGFTAHFSFFVDNGRCGVFGPSGSGKTTLMYMLAGLLTPDSGKIVLNGEVLFDHLAGINIAPEKRRIGIVFQHARLFPHMDVRQNLLFGQKRLPACERIIEPAELVDILNLKTLLNRSVCSLSGGERQRVALARTILANPRLILLDEPLSGLDGSLKYQVIPYLRQVFARFSIPFLFISHSVEEMRLMTEQILLVAGGRVSEIVAVENLACKASDDSSRGYGNLLFLTAPKRSGQLMKYHWGEL
ncbi:MAG: molybdenum ABC transporter ATP-binding protein, partial [Deltaproteobacteria bacterium]